MCLCQHHLEVAEKSSSLGVVLMTIGLPCKFLVSSCTPCISYSPTLPPFPSPSLPLSPDGVLPNVFKTETVVIVVLGLVMRPLESVNVHPAITENAVPVSFFVSPSSGQVN